MFKMHLIKKQALQIVITYKRPFVNYVNKGVSQMLTILHTHGGRCLTTLLVMHCNDLLDRQSSEWGREEVTYFYVGDVFCIYLGTMYADFQEKILLEVSGKIP